MGWSCADIDLGSPEQLLWNGSVQLEHMIGVVVILIAFVQCLQYILGRGVLTEGVGPGWAVASGWSEVVGGAVGGFWVVAVEGRWAVGGQWCMAGVRCFGVAVVGCLGVAVGEDWDKAVVGHWSRAVGGLVDRVGKGTKAALVPPV